MLCSIGKRRSVFQPIEPKPITRSGPPKRYNTPNNYDKKPAVIQNTDIVTKTEDVKPKIKQNMNINQEFKPMIKQDIKKDYNYQQTDNKNNSYESNECNTNQKHNEKETTNSNLAEECRPSSALSKFYKKRLPHYNSDMDFPSPDAENNSKGSAESGRQSSTSKTIIIIIN